MLSIGKKKTHILYECTCVFYIYLRIVDNTLFTGENSLVKVTMKGTREVIKVEISSEDSLDKDDIEMLQDMILVAVNEASSKIDKMTEEKLGKYGNSMPGLF